MDPVRIAMNPGTYVADEVVDVGDVVVVVVAVVPLSAAWRILSNVLPRLLMSLLPLSWW